MNGVHPETSPGHSAPTSQTAALTARVRALESSLAQANRSEERIRRVLGEANRRMETDLQLAAEFQRAILPPAPDVPFLDIEVCYLAVGHVSGDIYHLLRDREGAVNVFIGDATGHGVTAALMTMMAYLGLGTIRRDLPTNEILGRLNRLLAGHDTGRSISGVLLRVEPDGTLTATHAGHPPAVVIPATGDPLEAFKESGCALGLFAEAPVPYTVETGRLARGDKVLMYTDGLVERRGPGGQDLGQDRLEAILSNRRALPAARLLSAIIDDVHAFAAGCECRDDMTAIVLEYKGNDA